MYKLVGCDLDGTLLNSSSAVSTENLKAISKIKEQGKEFAVVTGRTLGEIPRELLDLSDIKYIIYSDGAVIYDNEEKKVIYSEYIDKATVKQVYELLSSYDTMTEIFEDGIPKVNQSKLSESVYEYYEIDESYRPVITQTRRGYISLSKELDSFDKAEIFDVFFKNFADRQRCFEILSNMEAVGVTTSMVNNLEITAAGVTKGKALQRLCNILGIKKDEVIAVGDSSNDISMLACAGMALVPSNAEDKIKQAATQVICSNDENVVKYIAENF